jgi:hypothetical protein
MPAASRSEAVLLSASDRSGSSPLYTVSDALCKACERDQGDLTGSCGIAFDVHSTGLPSFTE